MNLNGIKHLTLTGKTTQNFHVAAMDGGGLQLPASFALRASSCSNLLKQVKTFGLGALYLFVIQ